MMSEERWGVSDVGWVMSRQSSEWWGVSADGSVTRTKWWSLDIFPLAHPFFTCLNIFEISWLFMISWKYVSKVHKFSTKVKPCINILKHDMNHTVGPWKLERFTSCKKNWHVSVGLRLSPLRSPCFSTKPAFLTQKDHARDFIIFYIC